MNHDDTKLWFIQAFTGFVARVHRVLHRVRQDQQQDQVKRVVLPDLPPPADAQEKPQEQVDHHAANDEFPPRHGHIEHGSAPESCARIVRPAFARGHRVGVSSCFTFQDFVLIKRTIN